MTTLLRRLAIAALSLGLLLVGLLLFASTETGFRTVLRPLLARWGVEVASGRVSLEGEIAARELRWRGGSIARLEASLDPWSLLPGRRLHLRALEVEGLAAELVADAAPEAQEPESDEGFSLPALQVGSARVVLISLRQLDAEGQPVWALGPATLALGSWEPGATGALSLASDFALPAAEPARSGHVAFEGTVGVPADADGSLALDGALDVTLAPDGLALHAEIDGEGALAGGLSLSSPLELRQGEQLVLGGVQLDLAFGGDGLSLDLAVERAPVAALLAALGAEQPSARGIELGLALEAALAPDSNQITIGKLRLEQRAPGSEPVVATAEGTITPGASATAELALTGPGADGGEGAASFSLADGAATLKVASLDLTPLLNAWLGGGDGAQPEQQPAGAEPAADFALAFEIGVLRFRELLVRDARGALQRRNGRLEFDLPAAQLGQGTLAGHFESGTADGQRELAWKLDAKRLNLGKLFRTLDPTSEGQLAGKLDLASEASARVPAGADPLDALEGRLDFALRDAKANGLPFQQYMASELAVGGLASLAFKGAEGSIPIRQGRAQIERLFVDGNAASFAVSGSLSADDIDLAVNPRLGPRLASDLAPRFANALFETASGALALPVAFRIEGPWGETRYAMRPAPPSLVGDVLGVTAEMVSGAARFLFGGGSAGAEGEAAETLAPEPGAEPAAEPAPDPVPAPD